MNTATLHTPCGTVEVRTHADPDAAQALLDAYLPDAGRFGSLQRASTASGVPYATAERILKATGVYVRTGRGRMTGANRPPRAQAGSGQVGEARRGRPLFSRWGRTIRSAHPYGTLRRLCDAYEDATRLFDAEPVETAARAAGMELGEARRVLGKLGVAS